MVALCSRRRRRRLGVVLGHISPFSGAPCSGSGELPLLLSAQRLSGKVCLVTGGASGIGRAICERLAREGASLAVLDTRLTPREGGATVLELATAARRQQQGEKDEECLVRSSGGAATHRNAEEEEDLFIKGSVTDAETVKAAMQAVVARFGRLDVLVNNAAILASSPLLETSEEEWDMFMAVNAKGAFLCLKAAVAQFMTQTPRGPDGIRGRVVNISSQHGMVACPGSLAYGVSKAAVAYMTRQVGVEYIGHGIVVNAVAPGRIMTGRPGSRMHGEGFTEEEAYENSLSRARTPHGALRLGVPRDIASAVAFLASDDATFIVGENLMVDGGYKAS